MDTLDPAELLHSPAKIDALIGLDNFEIAEPSQREV